MTLNTSKPLFIEFKSEAQKKNTPLLALLLVSGVIIFLAYILMINLKNNIAQSYFFITGMLSGFISSRISQRKSFEKNCNVKDTPNRVRIEGFSRGDTLSAFARDKNNIAFKFSKRFFYICLFWNGQHESRKSEFFRNIRHPQTRMHVLRAVSRTAPFYVRRRVH